jgi:hypothetical protein
MPKLSREITKSVFYLYRDRASAASGRGAVGTGFIVAHHYAKQSHYYGVTNHHVACTEGASVIRVNTRGGADVMEFGPEEWEFDPAGDDIAAIPLELDAEKHDVNAIPTSSFLGQLGSDVSVGDDVFMLGLFADHEGRERNNPMARFGNISMLPSADSKVLMRGREHECYIVDMHSRTGFSGSPVFVYRTFGSNLTQDRGESIEIETAPIVNQLRGGDLLQRMPTQIRSTLHYHTWFRFLGVHFAQFSERWGLEANGEPQEDANAFRVSTDGGFVAGVSGMTCVAPSWSVLQLLDRPRFRELRSAHVR